jgi:hypothetical protein
MALAIREVPGEMTGVLGSHREQLIDLALQAQHGEAITELQDLERGIEVVDRTLNVAREEIAHESGVYDLRKFDALAKPYERTVGPWLKKCRENGVEVVRERRSEHRRHDAGADPAELEVGQFYADIHEYREAHGLGAA